MRLDLLEEYYSRNHYQSEDFLYAKNLLTELEAYQQEDTKAVFFDQIDEAMLDRLIQILVDAKKNTIPAFVVLLRYFHVIGRKDLYIHLTKYVGGLDVIENILLRLERHFPGEIVEKVKAGLDLPVLGTHPREMPAFTEAFMARLKTCLSDQDIALVLDGNNHGVSEKAILPDKLMYEESPTLAIFLNKLHQKKITVLEDHLAKNKVWFEQNITQEVIDYVRENQEILSAVLDGDTLLMTKIPYDTEKYLAADNQKLRRYYACHCPFAREAILNDDPKLSPLWCHCSAGFEKFPFEVIFGKQLKVEILESALTGDDKCRFAVSLADVTYKK